MIYIPATFSVRPLSPTDSATARATCGTCGLSWDDGIATAYTPTPSGRCPFEWFHDVSDDAVDDAARLFESSGFSYEYPGYWHRSIGTVNDSPTVAIGTEDGVWLTVTSADGRELFSHSFATYQEAIAYVDGYAESYADVSTNRIAR